MRLKALAEIYTMHSFAQLCNLHWRLHLAKTTPKRWKREAIKQLAARYLELQRKGVAKKKSREERMSRSRISGLLYFDFHSPDIFFLYFLFCCLMSISTALGQSPFRYVQLCRLRLWHKAPMFQLLLLSFNCPLQGFEQKRSPTRQRRGVPTNLWAWRTESELRKHEKV